MVPAPGRNESAGMLMPSGSASPSTTVYSNTNSVVSVPDLYEANRKFWPTWILTAGPPPPWETTTGEEKAAVMFTVSPIAYDPPPEGREVMARPVMCGLTVEMARLATSAGRRHGGRSSTESGSIPPATLPPSGVNHLIVVRWSTPTRVPSGSRWYDDWPVPLP